MRPPVLQIAIRSKAALYEAWMPFLKGGGVFVPTDRPHALGEEVLILLTLVDSAIPLSGHVAWINPSHGSGNRPRGVGVQLADSEPALELRKRVEGMLAGTQHSSRPTHTI